MTHEVPEFREIVHRALGPNLGTDQYDLLPLSAVIERMQQFYLSDVHNWEAVSSRIELEENYISQLRLGIKEFIVRITELIKLNRAQLDCLEKVPLEPSVLSYKPVSELYQHFCETKKLTRTLNDARGKELTEFLLSHYLNSHIELNRLSRGLLSRLKDAAYSEETSFSIWNGNKFGQIFSAPNCELPKHAHAAGINRLIDGLYSELGFTTTLNFFLENLGSRLIQIQ